MGKGERKRGGGSKRESGLGKMREMCVCARGREIGGGRMRERESGGVRIRERECARERGEGG